jgi:pimeloyl-ACP methyl ester carboxylesterase
MIDKLRGLMSPRTNNSAVARIVPTGARALSTLPNAHEVPLIKLEVISSQEMTGIRAAEGLAVVYNLVYLLVVTSLARLRWAEDPSCATASCSMVFLRPDFRGIVWWNFVSCALITAVALLFSLYLVYLYSFRVSTHRPEVLWAILLLLPTVILCNNPALNLDRVEVLPRLGDGPSSALAVLRYGTIAYSISAVTLYMILKFGSLERNVDLSDVTYGPGFYLLRCIPMGLLFVAFFLAGIMRRVEFSPQPVVPLISLARNGSFGVSFPTPTITSTISVGLLQVGFLLFFIVRYVAVSRRVTRMSYREARLKVINVFFLYRHTIIPLLLTMMSTAATAAVFPTPLTQLRYAGSHAFTQEHVLDVPYYARSGIVAVYTAWAIMESFCMLPSVYRPTFLERLLIERLGVQSGAAFAPAEGGAAVDEHGDAPPSSRRGSRVIARSGLPKPLPQSTVVDVDALRRHASAGDGGEPKQTGALWRTLSEAPVVWRAPAAEAGPERSLTFRFDESVLAWSMSWLAYMSDAVIEAALRDHAGGAFKLQRIWREGTYDQCVLVASSPDLVVVAFRGSVSAVNMRVNLAMSQVKLSGEDPDWLRGMWRAPTWGAKTPAIHRGFSAAYGRLRDEMLTELQSQLAVAPARRILCCGHSLGGALSTLLALDCRTVLGVPDAQVTCITFGSPRVGNRAFARRFAVAVSDSWRVVNLDDFISNYPKRKLQGYDHVPRCVLVTGDGNLILDPRFPDLKLFHGSKMRAHVLAAYKDSLQSFVDVAFESTVDDGSPRFVPDWWDFSKYGGADNEMEVAAEAMDLAAADGAVEGPLSKQLSQLDSSFDGHSPSSRSSIASLRHNRAPSWDPVLRAKHALDRIGGEQYRGFDGTAETLLGPTPARRPPAPADGPAAEDPAAGRPRAAP